ncbi:hypothetical protein [uncultured Dubosiella sp.]|nr:hypothetical protein [uncultured Dubosiella sp.]
MIKQQLFHVRGFPEEKQLQAKYGINTGKKQKEVENDVQFKRRNL